MACSNSATLLKTPRRIRVISAKRSTMCQEADVGVKWMWKRGCFFSHRLTAGVLWVA